MTERHRATQGDTKIDSERAREVHAEREREEGGGRGRERENWECLYGPFPQISGTPM